MNKNYASFRCTKEETGLVLIDIQEKLVRAMDQEEWELMEKEVGNLIHLAKLYDFPIFLTEQYPKGLGSTVPSVQKELEGAKHLEKLEKLEFSAWKNEEFQKKLQKYDLSSLVVVGMECHICVAQTVLDLLEQEYRVFVPNNGVISRHVDDFSAGLDLMDVAGARIVSAEMIIFQVLEKAGTPEFKEMSRRIK